VQIVGMPVEDFGTGHTASVSRQSGFTGEQTGLRCSGCQWKGLT